MQVSMFRSKKKTRSSRGHSDSGLLAWAGNLVVFYLILLALITIPFLILFAILFIRTALDYSTLIIAGILVLLTATVVLLIHRRRQIRKRFEAEKKDVMEVIRTAAREGHNVNVSFLHGLIRLDYQGSNNNVRLLGGPTLDPLKALPMEIHSDDPAEMVVVEAQNLVHTRPFSIALELEKLSTLVDRGILTKEELQELKERLLKDEGV